MSCNGARAYLAYLKTHDLRAISEQPADHDAEDLLGAKPDPVAVILDAVILWQANQAMMMAIRRRPSAVAVPTTHNKSS